MEPVQILSIEKNFALNPEIIKLKKVFRNYSNKNVAIISVIGSCQTGKSFFLNYLQRALSAAQDENDDLLGQENFNQELTGFSWINGAERTTSGLWISSDPAILKTCRGEEVAVFLLDFQSIFDEFSSSEENLILLGLCQQISNYTILNVKYELNEEKIGNLGEILKSLTKILGQVKFKKFSLLLRDHDEVSHESNYFCERLQISKNHSEKSKENREILKFSLDDEKTCFVLPNPGKNSKLQNFNGSLNELEPNFFRSLEKILLKLVNLDHINPSGKYSNGSEFLKAFQNFCQIIQNPEENLNQVEMIQNSIQNSFNISQNSQNLPQFEENIHTSSSPQLDISSFCQNILKNTVENVKILVTQSMFGFIPQDKLSDIMKNEIIQAKNEVENAELKESYKYKIIKENVEKLERKLNEKFEEIKISNSKNIQSAKKEFETKFEEIENIFKSQLDDLYLKENSLAAIKQKSGKILKENLSEFEIAIESLDPGMKFLYMQELSKKLNEYSKKSITDFEEFQKEKERVYWEFEKESKILEYVKHMGKETEDFQKWHKVCVKKLLGGIKNLEYKSELESSLKAKFDKIIQQKESKSVQKAFETNMNGLSIEVKDRYLKKIKDYLNIYGNNLENIAQLKSQHTNVKEDELNFCKTQLRTQNLDQKETKKIIYTISQDIDSEYEVIERKEIANLEEKNQIILRLLEENLEKGKKGYDEKMTGWKELENFDQLQSLHNQSLENSKSCILSTSDLSENHEKFKAQKLNELNEHIQNKFTRIKSEFESNFKSNSTKKEFEEKQNELEFQRVKIDCLEFYKSQMGSHFSEKYYTPHEDLIILHKNICSQIFTKYEISNESTISKIQLLLDDSFKVYKERNFLETPGDPAIGIDLGTTYSCVSIYRNGKVEIISNEFGNKTVPSYVAYINADCIVGELAKQQAHEHPQNTIFDAKRLIGRKFTDEKVKEDMKLWPFKVVNENGNPSIEVNQIRYTPEQISANVLKYLKTMAEKYLGGGTVVKKAVITVPAYFNDGQRQATIDAGEIAGLEVLEIINEPTAAAIAFHEKTVTDRPRKVLVYDLGGGTFDVSVLEMDKNNINVLAVGGDTHLGGEDFDNKMVEWCIKKFREKEKFDLSQGRDSLNVIESGQASRRLRRLRNECERRKKDISIAPKAKLRIEAIYAGKDFDEFITKKEFEEMNQEYFDRTLVIVQQILSEAKLEKNQIDEVVLVGGSTKISKVQEMLSAFFDGKVLSKKINPDEAVAHGAAIRAAIMNGEKSAKSINFSDVTPHSLGIELHSGRFSIIIPKNTKYPVSKKTRQLQNCSK